MDSRSRARPRAEGLSLEGRAGAASTRLLLVHPTQAAPQAPTRTDRPTSSSLGPSSTRLAGRDGDRSSRGSSASSSWRWGEGGRGRDRREAQAEQTCPGESPSKANVWARQRSAKRRSRRRRTSAMRSRLCSPGDGHRVSTFVDELPRSDHHFGQPPQHETESERGKELSLT